MHQLHFQSFDVERKFVSAFFAISRTHCGRVWTIWRWRMFYSIYYSDPEEDEMQPNRRKKSFLPPFFCLGGRDEGKRENQGGRRYGSKSIGIYMMCAGILCALWSNHSACIVVEGMMRGFFWLVECKLKAVLFLFFFGGGVIDLPISCNERISRDDWKKLLRRLEIVTTFVQKI